jgi:hypothetical protein
MTNDPGAPGDQPQHGNQGWQGGPQQPPPYPGSFGQEPPPPPGWGGYPPPPPQVGPPPGYGGYPGPGGPAGGPVGPGSPQGEAKGFFPALFDFGFNSFATPAVVKVLYIIGMVLLGLFYVAAVISGFSVSAGFGLLALVGGAIAVLFYLTLFRITLEFYYAIVRMSEDIHHRR